MSLEDSWPKISCWIPMLKGMISTANNKVCFLQVRVPSLTIYLVDTLIVWTDPESKLDIALSFQDADGCEDTWQFICEVQKHLISVGTFFSLRKYVTVANAYLLAVWKRMKRRCHHLHRPLVVLQWWLPTRTWSMPSTSYRGSLLRWQILGKSSFLTGNKVVLTDVQGTRVLYKSTGQVGNGSGKSNGAYPERGKLDVIRSKNALTSCCRIISSNWSMFSSKRKTWKTWMICTLYVLWCRRSVSAVVLLSRQSWRESVLFNDNGIFEYILQDDVFLGVIGMLECEF